MDGIYGKRAVRLGRVRGIDIGFDYSWLLILVLLVWSLSASFMHWHPTWSTPLAILIALVAVLLFFGSVLLHELAHSLVALIFGVPVKSITLFLFGGISDVEHDPPRPGAEFVMAVAGPLTSIILGVVLLAVGSTFIRVRPGDLVAPAVALGALGPGGTILMWLGPINILIGLFNLIPAFPLDGGRILRSIIWAISGDLRLSTRWASVVGQVVGWFFVLVGISMIFGIPVPLFGHGLIPGLWIAFVGWFLSSTAAATWRREVVQEALAGVSVSRLMRPAPMHVRPNMSVDSFIDESLMRGEERAFPVVDDDGRMLGLITQADVRLVSREKWPVTTVAQIMTPCERLVTTAPTEDAAVAFTKLTRRDVSQLPVMDHARLVGMLLRSDATRWIELHTHARQPRSLAY